MQNLNRLTKAERKFYLSIPKGIENAIPARRLTQITGMNARTLTACANGLRRKGFSIGSSRSNVDGGYYIITNEQELNSTVREMEANANKQLQSVYALKKGWRNRKKMKQ
ncbi:MAG: hypothetical protein SPG62_06775 [Lactobacillus johnsonii]|nr:hypothetical protein [Lactobacillus johnsonii]